MTFDVADLIVARANRQRDLMQAMQEQMGATLVRVTNEKRSVAAEVDGLGALTGLWLTESAYVEGPEALAGQILETVHAAARLAVDRQSFLAGELSEQLTALLDEPLQEQ